MCGLSLPPTATSRRRCARSGSARAISPGRAAVQRTGAAALPAVGLASSGAVRPAPAAGGARRCAGAAPVGAGYLVVTNKGKTADRLVSASAGISAKVEIHEMAVVDGVMRMRALDHETDHRSRSSRISSALSLNGLPSCSARTAARSVARRAR